MMKIPSVVELRKTLAAVAGVIAQVIALGVLHGTALHYTQIVAAAVAAVLVYVVPNGPAAPKP